MAAVEMAPPMASTSALAADTPENYDDLVQQLVASASSTYTIHTLRDRFLDKALETRSRGEVPIGEPGWELSGRTDAGNPCAMGEEIKGQKDYFRKLKFKYQEQESKLIFLGSITTDEPTTALDDQIEEAEKTNAQKKSQLKATKLQAQQIRDEAAELSREVEAVHTEVQKDAQEAATLSKQIKEIELELTRLRAMYPPSERLTTSAANDILDAQLVEMQELDDEVKRVNLAIDAVRDEVSRTAKEVGRLSRERDREEARAREARAGREKVDEQGRAMDGKVDELCRWYTSAIDLYKQLLGIASITAVSETELHLVYAMGEGQPYATLALFFDAATKRLVDAQLLPVDGVPAVDIQESVGIAVAQNDVPGLVGEVLARLR